MLTDPTGASSNCTGGFPNTLSKNIRWKLVAFNVDPLFNNSVDGLMYIKIADLPESTVKPVMEEFQAELERKLSESSED